MPDHEVSFGFHDFWQTAYEAFPRFWEVYPRLLEAINSLVWRNYGETNPLQHIIINLGIVGATSLSEITTLAGNGLGLGAMKIARSMLESAINAEFLRKFPEHLKDYFDWWIVERYKLMKYVRTDSGTTVSFTYDPFGRRTSQGRVLGRGLFFLYASAKTTITPVLPFSVP
jgi:hypothetical protein